MSGPANFWRRTLPVTLLSFSSGLPLGLVWVAIPDWLNDSGVPIHIVGLLTLTQAPWSFKILWSPMMDRFALPFLGRRRGWIALTQIALAVLTASLAGVGHRPETPWVVFSLALAIAIAAASQDIVVDAYAVEVLRREELGLAAGVRTALYRVAMLFAGSIAITLAAWISWPGVCCLLAALYLPMLAVTRFAPEPETAVTAPTRFVDAVWQPFLEFLGRPRALEILTFVLLYKLADNLAQSLQRPFLENMGYDEVDRGIAVGAIGLACTLVGVISGGWLTSRLGLGHSLWLFGGLQIFSNAGFILVSTRAVDRPLMFSAMGFESLSSGLGMGAFGVLLLRLTEKRFSATQYALFSSAFGLPRILAGPVTGFAVHEIGWTWFFWLTIAAGVPGLIMLSRYVPLGTRDPQFTVEPVVPGPPVATRTVAVRGLWGGVSGFALAWLAVSLMNAFEAVRQGGEFDLSEPLMKFLVPDGVGSWLALFGALSFAAVCGLLVAAVVAARRRPLG